MAESHDEVKRAASRKRSINFACIRFLGKVLWRQGAASNDLVDTLADELTSRVEHLAEWCYDQRGDSEIVVRAIAYLATHHDGPWKGTEWFVDALSMLIEIAVPNTGLDEDTAEFLMDMRTGVMQSYQSAPTSKSALRVTDDIAKDVKTLQNAARECSLISEILGMNEELFHGAILTERHRQLMLTAATAAPFVRHERES